jgi:hypothetical protein
VLIFWWYHVDKAEHGYRAGPLLNGGMLLAVVVAMPIYFIRSRGWKNGGTGHAGRRARRSPSSTAWAKRANTWRRSCSRKTTRKVMAGTAFSAPRGMGC